MNELDNFYSSIRDILSKARQKAYTAVNFAMVEAYWSIGRMIVEKTAVKTTIIKSGLSSVHRNPRKLRR